MRAKKVTGPASSYSEEDLKGSARYLDLQKVLTYAPEKQLLDLVKHEIDVDWHHRQKRKVERLTERYLDGLKKLNVMDTHIVIDRKDDDEGVGFVVSMTAKKMRSGMRPGPLTEAVTGKRGSEPVIIGDRAYYSLRKPGEKAPIAVKRK